MRIPTKEVWTTRSLNYYAYCSGDPIAFYDPSGNKRKGVRAAKELIGFSGTPKIQGDNRIQIARKLRHLSRSTTLIAKKFNAPAGTRVGKFSKPSFIKKISGYRGTDQSGETFISPTQALSEGYDGVLVQFKVKIGTTDALLDIGVGDSSMLVNSTYYLPTVQKGWTSGNAYFKGEGMQINIGLGKGNAVDIFNNNIIRWIANWED